MYKSVLFVLAIFGCAKCLPINASHSESSSSSELHLFVNNSTQSMDYHLTPVVDELEDVDRLIDEQLTAILPYLNFFFDTLLNQPKDANTDDCINDMVIELVPDETAMPPKSTTQAKKAEDDQEPSSESIGKPDEESSKDKSVAKPVEVSTPEKPTVVPPNPKTK